MVKWKSGLSPSSANVHTIYKKRHYSIQLNLLSFFLVPYPLDLYQYNTTKDYSYKQTDQSNVTCKLTLKLKYCRILKYHFIIMAKLILADLISIQKMTANQTFLTHEIWCNSECYKYKS